MRWLICFAALWAAMNMAPAIAEGAAQAYSTLRNLPPQARSAKMGTLRGDRLSLNGKPYRLAAGAQIRDARNLIVLPMNMQDLPDDINVRYLLDGNGDVYRLWMLTPEEAGKIVNGEE